jgi:hypothetical protein
MEKNELPRRESDSGTQFEKPTQDDWWEQAPLEESVEYDHISRTLEFLLGSKARLNWQATIAMFECVARNDEQTDAARALARQALAHEFKGGPPLSPEQKHALMEVAAPVFALYRTSVEWCAKNGPPRLRELAAIELKIIEAKRQGRRPLGDLTDIELRIERDRVMQLPADDEMRPSHEERVRAELALRDLEVDTTGKGGVEIRFSKDFTSLVVDGVSSSFTKGNQAETIRVLWEARKAAGGKDGHGLNEETIAQQIGASDGYRVRHTFKGHPAYKTLIRKLHKGQWCLCLETPPDARAT